MSQQKPTIEERLKKVLEVVTILKRTMTEVQLGSVDYGSVGWYARILQLNLLVASAVCDTLQFVTVELRFLHDRADGLHNGVRMLAEHADKVEGLLANLEARVAQAGAAGEGSAGQEEGVPGVAAGRAPTYGPAEGKSYLDPPSVAWVIELKKPGKGSQPN